MKIIKNLTIILFVFVSINSNASNFDLQNKLNPLNGLNNDVISYSNTLSKKEVKKCQSEFIESSKREKFLNILQDNIKKTNYNKDTIESKLLILKSKVDFYKTNGYRDQKEYNDYKLSVENYNNKFKELKHIIDNFNIYLEKYVILKDKHEELLLKTNVRCNTKKYYINDLK